MRDDKEVIINMKVILYSTGCPRCEVLKEKLEKASIDFNIVDDVNILESMQFDILPMLEVNGKIMDFKEAIKWVGAC